MAAEYISEFYCNLIVLSSDHLFPQKKALTRYESFSFYQNMNTGVSFFLSQQEGCILKI